MFDEICPHRAGPKLVHPATSRQHFLVQDILTQPNKTSAHQQVAPPQRPLAKLDILTEVSVHYLLGIYQELKYG